MKADWISFTLAGMMIVGLFLLFLAISFAIAYAIAWCLVFILHAFYPAVEIPVWVVAIPVFFLLPRGSSTKSE